MYFGGNVRYMKEGTCVGKKWGLIRNIFHIRALKNKEDLRKLSVKRWRTKALDREEWAPIIREAKAKLKGPSAIGRRRRRRRRSIKEQFNRQY